MMDSPLAKDSGRKLLSQSDVRVERVKGWIIKNYMLRVGIWNVQTLLKAGKSENLKEEMKRTTLDIIGLSEVRKTGLEGEVEDDDKGPEILESEVKQGVKQMKNSKAVGNYDILVEILKKLDENSIKIITKFINSIY